MTMKPFRTCTLSYHPPGFTHSVEIPFAAKGLSVCEKCKKNYKTRELCRHRYGHTALPTGLTYICITMDSTCTKEDGTLIDGPLVAQSIPRQPYLLQEDLNGSLPICSLCKEKNYTRSYCRNKLCHKMLPWNTNYVVLSAANVDYSNRLNTSRHDHMNQNGERMHKTYEFEGKDKQSRSKLKSEGQGGNVFQCEAMSRTFLAQVRVDLNKINWLEHDTGSTWEPSYSSKYMPGGNSEFGNNSTWDPSLNTDNQNLHRKETQYNTGTFSSDYGHWNRNHYTGDFNNNTMSWNSRRYNSIPKDFEYFSPYYGYNSHHGPLMDAMPPQAYVTDYNSKYLTQGQPNERGLNDRNSNGVENTRDRQFDSYGHYEVENTFPHVAAHHPNWGYQQERQYNQHRLPDQYSSYEERPSQSVYRSNSNQEKSNFLGH